MGTIVVVENVSLDGVMQSPGRPDEDTRGGFTRGGWASAWLARDPVAAQASMSGQELTAALLLGRRTYLDLVGHWLGTPDPNPFTEILRTMPKYVVSGSLSGPLPHPASTLLPGDPAVSVAALRDRVDGQVVVLGSGMLVRALAAADLVDEYVLTTIPVVLGGGTRLFGATFAETEVVRSVTSPTGVVVATHRVVRPAQA
jgi:dihydrofolate reductase